LPLSEPFPASQSFNILLHQAVSIRSIRVSASDTQRRFSERVHHPISSPSRTNHAEGITFECQRNLEDARTEAARPRHQTCHPRSDRERQKMVRVLRELSNLERCFDPRVTRFRMIAAASANLSLLANLP
jgi:hypothetical protein